MPYPTFDRSRLRLEPLDQRQHDMYLSECRRLDADVPPLESEEIEAVADRIVHAHHDGRQVILMMGAHMIKVGLSRYIVDLLKRGIITHLGMNGASVIHDFELALIGATTESVARYIRTGQFGLWEETGHINDAIKQGAEEGMGLGEVIGRTIEQACFPHREISILATAYRLRIPATVHVGVGYDIIHQHPNCDGAALGETSYRDFLTLAHTISQLQNGVFLNFGSAVMGPEVYLKALAMARNVAHQEGRSINSFTTAVFDLQDLGSDYHTVPSKVDACYYFRPLKTILVRTVQDGGESFYIRGSHQATFPHLYHHVLARLGGMSDG